MQQNQKGEGIISSGDRDLPFRYSTRLQMLTLPAACIELQKDKQKS